jgi:hypothetical protein
LMCKFRRFLNNANLKEIHLTCRLFHLEQQTASPNSGAYRLVFRVGRMGDCVPGLRPTLPSLIMLQSCTTATANRCQLPCMSPFQLSGNLATLSSVLGSGQSGMALSTQRC